METGRSRDFYNVLNGQEWEHYEKGAYYFSYTLGQRMVSSI